MVLGGTRDGTRELPLLSDTQRDVQAMVDEGMRSFPPDYWRNHDASGAFPHEFFDFAAAHDWLGIAMPPEFGGAGLGISEAAIMLEAIARSGAGLSATSAIHMNVFGTNVVVKHGTPEQRERFLPAVTRGEMKVAFGVTEPDAGLETSRISTRARREKGHWRIDGRKVWITTAQVAHRVLLLVRSSDAPADGPAWKGLTLFFAPLDRDRITIREIRKAGRAAVDSNELFIDGLIVADEDRIGAEGEGFRLLLDGLNPERVLVAAEAIGMGRAALRIAVDYANERRVFGRPIGMNQGIQLPLAEVYARLECAWLMVMRGAALYDAGQPCGAEANIAKLLGAEWGFRATDRAMQTLGGYGYAAEYDVERLWRETKLTRLAPITPELILTYLAERKLGLPRSY